MNRLISKLSALRPARQTTRDDASRRKAARRLRPALDALEGRTVLSTVTFVVTNGGDIPSSPAPNSLRWVIEQADAQLPGTSVVIDFDISSNGGSAFIEPGAPLPAITHPVTINGNSQPVTSGDSNGANVNIDGSGLTVSSDGLDFTAGASGSVVEGLCVTNFGSVGLRFEGASDVQLVDDVVGIWNFEKFYTTYIAPNEYGVEFDGGSNETISDDLIAGNTIDGLRLIGTSDSVVESSQIGTELDYYGTDDFGRSLGNGGVDHYGTGLYIDNGSDNTVSNNVISNNGTYGILISGPSAYGNDLTSNLIGTDSLGHLAEPNMTGVMINGGASVNLLSGNLISGNSWDGVAIDGSGTNENELISNEIGTGMGGMTQVANWNGIQIVDNAAYTFVYDNIISGNDSDGVFLAQTQYDDIQQNQIGLAANGTAMGNGTYGLILVSGSSYNTVYGNAIQYNSSDGLVTVDAWWDNSFYYNSVIYNGGGNISLG